MAACRAFSAAAANAAWDKVPNFYEILTQQPGKASWPITGASFILLHANAEKPERTEEVLKFFDWAFKNGDKLALDLDYVPLPVAVKDQVRNAWKGVTDNAGKPIF